MFQNEFSDINKGINDSIVKESLILIEKHACEPIDVNYLLQRLPLGRSAFYRRFRAAVGCTPHQRILHVRINCMKKLLAETVISLEKIGELTGFRHPEYMIYVFKSNVGMTPGDYRKLHNS